MNKNPILFIFSGLPGVGKTTLSKEISVQFHAVFFRLDTIEHGIKDLCHFTVQGEGYRLTERIAKDNLLIKNNVVIDCCNPYEFIRKEWMILARECNAEIIMIEIVCTDKEEHKDRVEKRKSDIEGFLIPSWEEVEKREYEEWGTDVIRIETSGKSKEESIKELIKKIEVKVRDFA